ncbi:T9SS type A sorting domain-containing protein [Flavobacterium sp.]|uniref:T9SS type A sorting domain-containing protein n=1 Tax=Flavobacterium sp. TaxID=239 RepID=UPI003782EB7C
MKKITLLILLISSFGMSQSFEGTWKMSPQAGAFAVGPSQGDGSYFANSLQDVTARACFFNDEYVFNADGTFTNVLGTDSWIEGWQGGSEACGTPVAPHNGSNAATWSYNSTANTITLTGVGAYLGLAKAYNGGELSNPSAAPASITYLVSSITSNLMTLDINVGTGLWWRFVLVKQTAAPTCTDGIQNGDETGVDCGGSCTPCASASFSGTWKMSPQAGAFAVGPSQGNGSYFANSLQDVATRACFFNDEYVFNANGTFTNVLGTDSWIEGWQGGSDACGTPVAPHNGSNAATWSYNSTANTVTLTGVGAYLGLAKAYNGGELSNPSAAPASITYLVSSITSNLMTLDINVGTGLWWRFVLVKQTAAPTCTDGIQNGDETGVDCGGSCTPCASASFSGTWKMSPQAGAFAVGPSQGNGSYFANSLQDVATRACFFNDEYVFNANGTFTNVLGTDSWIEGWQGGSDACGTPVAPHNGSNAATWSYNSTANTVTLTGVGAYLGLAKAYNGGELSNPSAAPASITYLVSSITSNLMTLDINVGTGLWWRFVLVKQGVTPTCSDGIQNGSETGIDCGGTCPNACLSQINLPVTFEGTSVDYTVTDFGGNVSTKVVDPTDASNTVIRSVKTSGAELWAGTTIGTNAGFSAPIPFTSANRKMYVRVWSPDAGIPVRLKVEVSGQPTQSCETQTNTTVANGWQTMEFDFNNQVVGTAVFNPSFSFNMASIFFNFGTTGALAGEKTYYFDNVNYGTPLLNNTEFTVSNFSLYPNPVKNVLNISSEAEIKEVNIYNTLGQLVVSKSQSSNNVALSTESLSKGVYIIAVHIQNEIIRKQFIKE